jgi:hypothetical protein
MRHEPSGSCRPAQQARTMRCPVCQQQVRELSDYFTTSASRSSRCRACRRAGERLASRRRVAAMRLLIAAHPEEWTGLLGLVSGRCQPARDQVAGAVAEGDENG